MYNTYGAFFFLQAAVSALTTPLSQEKKSYM